MSFHSGWTFHRADGNSGPETRRVLTAIFIDADMVMAEPQNDNQRADCKRWLPGVTPGEICDCARTPVVWSRA